jgi:hypothetical protein
VRVKPKASRKESSEIYYVGKGYKTGKFYQTLMNIDIKKVTFEDFAKKVGADGNLRPIITRTLKMLKQSQIERKMFFDN